MQHIAEPLTPVYTDAVVPFEVQGRDVAGRVTRIDSVVDTILGRHDYPVPIARVLGQALSLTALLGSIMKFEGVFTLQIKGDGPVSLLVCDFATPSGADGSHAIGGVLRGVANFSAEDIPDGKDLSLRDLLGDGYMALTIDQGGESERYQGIVELSGDNLDDCARHYFTTSEQLPSAVYSVCEPVGTNGSTRWRAGSVLIQHLPPAGAGSSLENHELDDETEDWQHTAALLHTIKAEEMLDSSLSLQDLLYRLYHEDGVRVFAPAHLALGCRCSREKLEDVIRTFSEDDVQHMVVDGKIAVTCQFCNTEYVFDPAEFGADTSGAPETGR